MENINEGIGAEFTTHLIGALVRSKEGELRQVRRRAFSNENPLCHRREFPWHPSLEWGFYPMSFVSQGLAKQDLVVWSVRNGFVEETGEGT